MKKFEKVDTKIPIKHQSRTGHFIAGRIIVFFSTIPIKTSNYEKIINYYNARPRNRFNSM